MPSYATSPDGTRIAFERRGQGPPVILVGGILSDRQTTRALAEQLAGQFCVINYDRRGRGDSSDTAPYAVERELEDLGALIAEAGGAASVYGHSSGAGLALNAAASGLPITRLVLHEPPYGPDDEDEESKRGARDLAGSVRACLAEGRCDEALTQFFAAYGLPPETVEEMSSNPTLCALAPTMSYDFDVMGEVSRGGTIPEDLVRAVRIPTLTIAGGASPAFFRDTATRIAGVLPNGRYTVLEGQDHDAPADVAAPVVAAFFTTQAPEEVHDQPYVVDPRVDVYIDALPDWQRDLCREVRDLVHGADPEVVETVKFRGRPYFVMQGNVCALLAAKDHVNVFLYDGAIVPDPERIITGGHENTSARTVAFRRDEPINAPALTAVFKQIIANNRAGGWRKIKRAQ